MRYFSASHYYTNNQLTIYEKNSYSSLYIKMEKIVKVTEKDIQDARRIEDDPEKILALIDLIFLNVDNSKVIPS